MRLSILSVGRAKRGPETDLFDTYAARIEAAGRSIGVGPLRIGEVAQSQKSTPKARQKQECDGLLGRLGSGTQLIALEERGKVMTSTEFANLIAVARDEGVSELAFAIGGPDGFGSGLGERPKVRVAFGKMTLPHGLARVLLAEQIYRALTILSGHPLSSGLIERIGIGPRSEL